MISKALSTFVKQLASVFTEVFLNLAIARVTQHVDLLADLTLSI